MKTKKFSCTMGVVAGYFHNNETLNTLEIVSLVWQQEALKVFNTTGIFISANVSESKTVYHTDWGCPIGGENTVLITGEANPLFTDLEKYVEITLRVIEAVRVELKQSTTQVTFSEVDFHYLKD